MAFPKVFINTRNRMSPVVANTAAQEAALDPREWSAVPLASDAANAGYPKLMCSVNVPPVLVFDAAQEQSLGSGFAPSPVVVPDVPPVEISPSGDSLGLAGGTGNFTVAITGFGKSKAWTATKDASADWLTFTPADAQTADGSVNYTVAANATGSARTAHIYVNGKTFTIDQAGGIA